MNKFLQPYIDDYLAAWERFSRASGLRVLVESWRVGSAYRQLVFARIAYAEVLNRR